MFFSDYGLFMHEIIAEYLSGGLRRDELAGYYLANFKSRVSAAAPNPGIFSSYFEQGLSYLKSVEPLEVRPLAVEQEVCFSVDGVPFTGFIDCVAESDSGLVVIDHKSRALKPRSKRKKPTQMDRELDDYLRQLYLYSVAVRDLYGEYPEELRFNCFRTNTVIRERFREDALERTKVWALGSIRKIEKNKEWPPDMDYWKCRYLCGHKEHCEYFQSNRS